MVVVDADDQLSPKLRQVEKSVKTTAREAATARAALRQMAYGISSLGVMAVGLGSSLQRSNNEMTKSIGNSILLAGTFLSGIGSAMQFISVIQRLTKAYKSLTTAQIIAKAFSGPLGWGTLAVGAAVGVGAIAASKAMSPSDTATAARGPVIIQNIQGSVVTERQLTENVRRGIIASQQRNATSGIQ
jgi:hypothetical protein